MGISNAPGTRTISICAHQRLDHEIVEPRGNQRKAQIARQQFPLDYLRLIVRHKSFLATDWREV